MKHDPPPILEFFLKKVVRPHDRESLLGDFQEVYQYRAHTSGRASAMGWYVFHLLKLIPSFCVNTLEWQILMFKNYVTVALRNLRKQKSYAFINIFGLAVGLACFILIGLFVQFELSYDRFHEKADRIYRIANELPSRDFLNQSAKTPQALSAALMEEVPEVEYATHIIQGNVLLEYGNTRFYEDGLYATEHFFDVFSFRVLRGKTQLVDPNSIILAESLAEKYFGEADPIGKVLTIIHPGETDRTEVTVTGIVEDIPATSHVSFDYLLPISSLRALAQVPAWRLPLGYTYASLHPDHSLPAFSAKVSALGKRHLSQLAHFQNNPDQISVYFPQALSDIHLRSHIQFELGANGDIKYVYLLSAVGLLILLLACINYINLATARSATRTKEVGVRKVMGAHRRQLIGQFMSESTLSSLAALLVALFLVYLLIPTFNTVAAREITLTTALEGGFLAILLLIGLGISILAGSYSAFTMSLFDPVRMVKGVLHQKAGKLTLRNVLVVFQFTVTIILVASTLVIKQQVDYIQNANTGVDRDQVIAVAIRAQTMSEERYAAFKQTLQNHPNVLGVTGAQTDPTYIWVSQPVSDWEGAEDGQRLEIHSSYIWYDYVDLFGLEVIEGRDFSEAMATDEREGVLINEAMKQQLGWDTAVGKWFTFRDQKVRVTGVVKDFNFLSFHEEIAPLALHLASPAWLPFGNNFVKVSPGDMQETLRFLEETMTAFFPGYPFEYRFLDDTYNQMYRTEVHLGNLFSFFTLLTLLIACLGLLGLTAFTTSQRTKEIGVRKVLGAVHSDILVLLSKDFTRLVGISFVLGAPVAYVAMNTWLQNFAYRISLGWGTFLLTGGAVLVLAWLTVSYQTIRAAWANPVESLRYE